MNPLDLTYPEPLQPVPTWNIHDSSKLSAAGICWRKYFYEYILGWRFDTPNLHLEFGTAWHLAMEHLLANIDQGFTNKLISEAYDRFLSHYRLFFDELDDESNAPKNPAGVLTALVEYTQRYSNDPSQMKVLFTEVSGAVPIDETHSLHFKLDAVIETELRGIFCLEHKTTGQDNASLRHGHHLGFQVGTYSHVLYSIYPASEVFGVIINAMIFRKGKKTKAGIVRGNEAVRIPICMSMDQLQIWDWHIRQRLRMLDWNFEQLSQCSPSEDLLCAFPMNEQSCCKYGVCPFHAFCTSPAWANPLQQCQQPPPGFRIEHWNPKERENETNFVYNDNKIVEQKKESSNAT